jgi:hypothetical protein
MLASRLHPRIPGGVDSLLAARGTPEEVLLPGPCVREVLYGLWRRAARDGSRFAAAATWFATTLLGEGGLRVLNLDGAGLVVAARLRARVPSPPSPRRKGQTKPDRRVGWVADIEIAAIAWRWQLPLLTQNEHDFSVLATALTELYPSFPPLEVRRPSA